MSQNNKMCIMESERRYCPLYFHHQITYKSIKIEFVLKLCSHILLIDVHIRVLSSLAISYLDYCNRIYLELLLKTPQKLQLLYNADTWVIIDIPCFAYLSV